jgi:hypothetical protein
MRKKILDTSSANVPIESHGKWLELAKVATVEGTSEDPRFPIESAFWRSAEPVDQQIRLVFDEPVPVCRIQLRFHEPTTERTHEFTLHWSATQGQSHDGDYPPAVEFQPHGIYDRSGKTSSLEGVSVLEPRSGRISPGETPQSVSPHGEWVNKFSETENSERSKSILQELASALRAIGRLEHP